MPFVRVALDRSDAICGIRHVFLEEDADGPGLLASLTTRRICRRRHTCCTRRLDGFMSSGGSEDSTSDTVEAMQKQLARELRSDTAATSCAQTTQASRFRQLQAPDARHRSRSNTCVRDAVFGADDFPSARSTAPDDHASDAASSAADHRRSCGSRPALSVGRRACRCRPARRPAHVSDLLSAGARIRACQITRRCAFSRSGTHGVSRRGPSRSCWRKFRTRGRYGREPLGGCSSRHDERDYA